MVAAIKNILLQTPWWVYLLLYVLIQRGIAASKTQVVPFAKMLILPILFSGLSIYTIVTQIGVNPLTLITWIVATVFGIASGLRMLRGTKIRVDRKKHLIEIPGTWRTLVLILIIFSAKYFFGYLMSANPAILHNTLFNVSLILVSGICSGMFVGNFFYYGQHYVNGPFATLVATDNG